MKALEGPVSILAGNRENCRGGLRRPSPKAGRTSQPTIMEESALGNCLRNLPAPAHPTAHPPAGGSRGSDRLLRRGRSRRLAPRPAARREHAAGPPEAIPGGGVSQISQLLTGVLLLSDGWEAGPAGRLGVLARGAVVPPPPPPPPLPLPAAPPVPRRPRPHAQSRAAHAWCERLAYSSARARGVAE